MKFKFGKEVKIRRLFIFVAQKQLFFIFYYKQDNFYSVPSHFLAKPRARNWVTMATDYAPGDQKVYQMMCNRLTVKITKFQQSSLNRFWAVLLGGGGRGKFTNLG